MPTVVHIRPKPDAGNDDSLPVGGPLRLAMTTIDLNIRRGDALIGQLTILKDGVAAPLAGCTLKAMLKANYSDADDDAILALTVGDGLTVIDALGGIVDLEISAEDTAELDPDIMLVWDFQVIEATGKPFTACGGDVYTTADVVRAVE